MKIWQYAGGGWTNKVECPVSNEDSDVSKVLENAGYHEDTVIVGSTMYDLRLWSVYEPYIAMLDAGYFCEEVYLPSFYDLLMFLKEYGPYIISLTKCRNSPTKGK